LLIRDSQPGQDIQGLAGCHGIAGHLLELTPAAVGVLPLHQFFDRSLHLFRFAEDLLDKRSIARV
jgi:hypothetical protein